MCWRIGNIFIVTELRIYSEWGHWAYIRCYGIENIFRMRALGIYSLLRNWNIFRVSELNISILRFKEVWVHSWLNMALNTFRNPQFIVCRYSCLTNMKNQYDVGQLVDCGSVGFSHLHAFIKQYFLLKIVWL